MGRGGLCYGGRIGMLERARRPTFRGQQQRIEASPRAPSRRYQRSEAPEPRAALVVLGLGAGGSAENRVVGALLRPPRRHFAHHRKTSPGRDVSLAVLVRSTSTAGVWSRAPTCVPRDK